MSAAAQLARIVALVAHLSRLARDEAEAPTLDELARAFGVDRRTIEADVRALTLLGDHCDADWLLSLRVWQQGDRLSVASAGPFRRPIRLSGEEWLAVLVALATDRRGRALARRLAALGGAGAEAAPDGLVGAVATGAARGSEALRELVGRAVADRRRLRLRYAAEGRQPEDVTVEPHQLVEARGHCYLVAWCPAAAGWRHYRLDRMLDAEPGEDGFRPRADFEPIQAPGDVFRPPAGVEQATVRFGPGLAPWIRERYPDHVVLPDGGIEARVPVANPDWLVRRVLEYGPDARVVGPPALREAVRRAVA